jgi:hypothetical protein
MVPPVGGVVFVMDPLVGRSHFLPSLYKWLRDERYVLKKGSKPYTHLAHDGGLVGFGPIRVPPKDWRMFYEKYASDWVDGQRRLYLTEVPNGPVYPLFFDFDMLFDASDDAHLSHRTISIVYERVQTLLRAYYPVDALDLYIGSTDVSPKHKDDRVYSKLGLHLIWPSIMVRTIDALRIRQYLVTELKRYGQQIPFTDDNDQPMEVTLQNTWDDVIDIQVTTTPKCRMFGSAKLDHCSCKRDKVDCHHVLGCIDTGRIYDLVAVYDGTAVHDDATYAKFARPDKVAKCDLLRTISLLHDDEPQPTPTLQSLDDIVIENPRDRLVAECIQDDKIHRIIHDYIETVHGMATAASIAKPPEFYKKPLHYVVQLKSRWCPNKGGEHNSNTTYIVVSPSYITQLAAVGLNRLRFFDAVRFFLCIVFLTLMRLGVLDLLALRFFLAANALWERPRFLPTADA